MGNRNYLVCQIEFEIPKYKPNAKFCSAPCRQIGNARNSAKKRGDIQRGTGEGKSYRKLNGRHEHRVIAEKMLGRPLNKLEIVHHINHDPLDNRPENLAVITRSEHAKIHNTKYASICSIDGCSNKHRTKGYCYKHISQINRHGRIMNI